MLDMSSHAIFVSSHYLISVIIICIFCYRQIVSQSTEYSDSDHTPAHRINMTEFKEYSLSDVATRNGRGTAPVWIVYKDSVYDLSKYQHEHPGGIDTIVEYAGKDATSAFEDVGHTGDAKQIMNKYKVGEIIEAEKRYDANGKKKKRVVPVQPSDKPQGRSCFNIITCGLVG